MISTNVMADAPIDCRREVIEQANMQYLQEISGYISLFSNQKNKAAVRALNAVEPNSAFRKKHAKEIERFTKDKNHKLSEQFCLDSYANLKDLRMRVAKIVSKYKTE